MSLGAHNSPFLSPDQKEHYKHLPVPDSPQVKPGQSWSQIFSLAIPNVASSLAMYSTVVITTLCISREDDPSLLAAFGLASLIGNVLGLSIGVGLNSVLETLVSQAYGANNMNLAAVHLNRARLVVTIAVIPCCFALFFTDSLLLWLEQDPKVSLLAAQYTRSFMFGLPAFFYFSSASSYLRSCQHPQSVLLANVVGSIIHLFVSILFINVLGWGLWGAGLSMSINSTLRFVMLEVFLSWKPALRGHEWTREMFSIRGIRHFLGLGIPSFLLVAVEWMAFELQSVIAGWISTQGLAAHIAGINVIAIVFMVPNGVSQSLSTLIGASLGEGLPKLGMDFAKKGAILMFTLACLYGIGIWLFIDPIANIYSSDDATKAILKSVLILASGFVVLDAMNTTGAGIIRGLGLQTKAAKYQMMALFGIMLPVGYSLYPHFGVPGIWMGSITGMTVSALLFLRVIKGADWKECSRRAVQESRIHILASAISDV
jgi:MATE family multidrug resistance protein